MDEKLVFFLLKLLLVFQKFDHSIGFEKNGIFPPKIGKNGKKL
jgi:hypothetical protein